jgi:hypothetical protein
MPKKSWEEREEKKIENQKEEIKEEVKEEDSIDVPTVTKYPTAFPLHAVDELTRIVSQRDWSNEKALLGRVVWELQGAAQRIYLGDPDKQLIRGAPIDVKELPGKLYAAREAVYKALNQLRVLTPKNLDPTDRVACEKLLDNVLVTLAWLRKSALDSTK